MTVAKNLFTYFTSTELFKLSKFILLGLTPMIYISLLVLARKRKTGNYN